MTEPREQNAWRDGGSRYHVDVDIARQELERINERDGGITPAAVVEDARPEEAPLHCAFEWEDSVAGEEWRRHQARNLIRAVKIVGTTGRERPAFLNAVITKSSGPPQRVYKPIEEVLSDPDALASAIGFLVEKIKGAQIALEEVKGALEDVEPKDGQMARVIAISEALTTARLLAGHLAA